MTWLFLSNGVIRFFLVFNTCRRMHTKSAQPRILAVHGRYRNHTLACLPRSLTVIIRNMRFLILPFLVFSVGIAYGAVVHVPIKSGVVLKPNETYTITVEATEPMEIGWQTVQAKRCTVDCVQATDISGGNNYAIATPLGA